MELLRNKIDINGIPAIIWGTPAKQLYLYIHGQGGNKEEAERIAEVFCKHGYQVLSLDLPEHGERKDEQNSFDPWHIVPELKSVMKFARNQWERISIFANSIGAWFSMLSFDSSELEHCLFVSPVLDMKRLILDMMKWADVSMERLEQEKLIETSSGQTLSWEYLQFTNSHPIEDWNTPTKILYAGNDALICYDSVKEFADRFQCSLTVMENGEHWFHTEEQLEFLRGWVEENYCSFSTSLPL